MNPHLSKGTTSQDIALITKHAGWAAVQVGKKAWVIDNGDPKDLWFQYTPGNIKHLRCVRKQVCEALIKGKTVWS